jgi:hypothetical protein
MVNGVTTKLYQITHVLALPLIVSLNCVMSSRQASYFEAFMSELLTVFKPDGKLSSQAYPGYYKCPVGLRDNKLTFCCSLILATKVSASR